MKDKNKEKACAAFSQRFRQALLELGYAPTEQQRLKKLFGVSGQAVRKWAEGQALPTAARMPQVASILGVRRAWLQDGEGPMRPVVARIAGAKPSRSDEQNEETLTKAEVDLVHKYRKLNAAQQGALFNLVKLIIS